MSEYNLQKGNFTKRVLFIGIPDMAYVCLDGLKTAGVNIVGVMGAKKNHGTYQNFKDFVSERNLNFIEYDDMKDEKFLQTIKDLKIDVAVVCSFNYKVPKVFLDAIKDGFINVHPSLLPSYRGKNPYSSVIINNESQTGVTLHFMDEGWDTGDIIMQVKVPINPKETMGTLFNRLNFVGFEMLLKSLMEYEKAPLPRSVQPQGDFILAGSFEEQELFINYNKSAIEIDRFVRGLNPFLIASTWFRNTFVKVYKTEIIKNPHPPKAPPGTIVKVDKDRFLVTTKDGFLSPTVIQFGSFFTGNAKDFIEILNPKIGEKFGE